MIEESCLICKYSLLVSPDNEKTCLACKITESKIFINSLKNQCNELISQFQKLTTPSKNQAADRILNFPEYNDLEEYNLNFSLTFSQFVANLLQKGYILTITKCQTCNYNLFKNENINQPRCFKCEYNNVNKNEEIFNHKLKNFCHSIHSIPNYYKEPTKMRQQHFEPLQDIMKLYKALNFLFPLFL